MAAITSQIPDILVEDEFLIPTSELAACGLPKPSIIKLAKLVAIHQQLLIKRIGALPASTLTREQFRQLF